MALLRSEQFATVEIWLPIVQRNSENFSTQNDIKWVHSGSDEIQVTTIRSQSYKRNLVLKKAKLVLNSLTVLYVNLDLIIQQFNLKKVPHRHGI